MNLHFVNGLKLRQEPSINASHLPNLLHCVALVERGSKSENALVGRICEFLVNILDEVVLYTKSAFGLQTREMDTHIRESRKLIIDRPNSLLESLFERPPYAHDLPNALHAATQ